MACVALLPSLCGCAGPSPYEWSDPLYQYAVDRRSNDDASTGNADPAAPTESRLVISQAYGEQLTIDDAIRLAMMNHPELARIGHQVSAASAREVQAGLHPNPSFVFDAEALGSEAGPGGETAYLLEQEFLTAGKRKKTAAVAEADRIRAQTVFRATEFAIATAVRRQFTRAVAAQRRHELLTQLAELSRTLETVANARVEAGDAAEPDRLRAEVVAEQAAIDQAAAASAAIAAQLALAAAIGDSGAERFDLKDDLDSRPAIPERRAIVELAIERNQRIDLAELGIERAERAHDLAKANATPNVVAAIGPRYSDPENETTLDVGASIELPIFDRNQGEIAATLADRLSASAALGAVKLSLISAVSDAWSAYASAQSTISIYEQSLLPKAERTLTLTREAYEAGKADYLRLLDAQQSYIRSQVAYVDALEALHLAVATLEGLMQRDAPWRQSRPFNTGESS